MNKRNPTPKSLKAHSKINVSEQQYNPQHLRMIFDAHIKAQMSRLEKLIYVQSQARQKQSKQLFGMIKHLEETKKSKLTLKNGTNRLERFFSPNRSSKNIIHENQSMVEYKNLLTTLKSETQLQVHNNKDKVHELETQINSIKLKIVNMQKLQMNMIYLNQEINHIKRQPQIQINQLKSFQNRVWDEIKNVKANLFNQFQSFKKQYSNQMQLIKQNGKIERQKLNNIISSQLQKIPSIVNQNVCQHASEQSNWLQIRINEQLRTKLTEAQNKLKQFILIGARKFQQMNIQWVEKSAKQLQVKLCLVDNCVKVCQQTLKNIQQQTIQSFDILQHKVKIASQSIIQTKQTIQETFYGADYRSKEKLESQSSLDCTQETQPISYSGKRVSETAEKMNYMDNRIKWVERRMDSLYSQYLAKPFHKQSSQQFIR